jgi:hypothetical protein
MRLALASLVVAVALGCGASSQQPGPQRASNGSKGGVALASDPAEPATEYPGRGGAAGADAGEERTPVALAEPTHCELVCAEVHACLLAQGDRAAAAASIELGCLGACVGRPERGTLFGCEPPASTAAEACAPFLACVRDAWPEERGSDGTATVVVPSGEGCQLACEAFGRCRGISSDDWAIAECVKICDRSLDEELERQAGACALLPECSEIERCIEVLPGA